MDPFEARVAIPESLKPGANRKTASPDEDDGDHASAGGPRLQRPPPRRGRGSGARDDQDGVVPSFDPTAGPAKLYQALTGWLTADMVRSFVGDGEACAETCSGARQAPASAELACKLVPALRAIPETAVPCASIEAAEAREAIASTWCHKQCEALFLRVR